MFLGDSQATVFEQSAWNIDSFYEEGVDPEINKLGNVTGGGTSTSSGEPAVMLNTKQAEHDQRYLIGNSLLAE